MDAKWVPAVHYTHPRDSRVTGIVLHWMATTLAGCDATFTSGQRQASAHYGIENGTVHQYVREGDAAWHAGVRSVNHSTIGIEHSAQPGRDATEATVQTSIALCTELCRRYGLTANAISVHRDHYATQCPGTLPVARIKAGVAANLAGTPQEDEVTPEDIQKIALAVWSYDSDVKGQTMWRRLTDAVKGAPQAAALAVMSYPSDKEGVTMWRRWVNGAQDAAEAPVIDAAQIAAAIPDDIAKQVADILAARLTN